MHGETPFMVVSVDKAENSAALNEERQQLFELQLNARSLPFKKVIGVYNGDRETSYIVLNANEGDSDKILPLARRYGQESVLSVDFNRFATLLFLHPGNGGPDVRDYRGVGFWRELDDGELLPHSYTLDGNKVYSTRAFA